MNKVVLNLAQTLDGYICRPDGTVDYLDDMAGDMDAFQSFVEDIDVIVMGRTTYDEYVGYGFDYYKNQELVIWTTRPQESYDNVTFFTGTLEQLMANYHDKTIWCFGGTKVITQFLAADVIDEYHITTVPYLLGKGKVLFETGDYEQSLKLDRTIIHNGVITAIYHQEKKQ